MASAALEGLSGLLCSDQQLSALGSIQAGFKLRQRIHRRRFSFLPGQLDIVSTDSQPHGQAHSLHASQLSSKGSLLHVPAVHLPHAFYAAGLDTACESAWAQAWHRQHQQCAVAAHLAAIFWPWLLWLDQRRLRFARCCGSTGPDQALRHSYPGPAERCKHAQAQLLQPSDA